VALKQLWINRIPQLIVPEVASLVEESMDFFVEGKGFEMYFD